jgi:hypothetical protein
MKFKNINPYTKIGVLLLIAALFIPITAQAGVNQWTSIGPFEGNVRSLSVDPQTPSTLYATIRNEGIYKSIDSGNIWTAINTGLTSLRVNAFVIDPQTPSTLYAGTSGHGVFKSTDSGNTWDPINTGLTDNYISALAIDPQAPSTLYVHTYFDGVFKSTDSGNNWSVILGIHQVNYAIAFEIIINPQTPSTLYVNTYDIAGIYKSTDGGNTWNTINAGLTNLYIDSLAIDPQTPSTVYAGTYRGLFKSTNGGSYWNFIGLTDRSVYVLVIDPQTPSILYAGTDQGVFKSIDSGDTWFSFSDGMGFYDIACLAIDPQASSVLYAGTNENGAFKCEESASYIISGRVTYYGYGLNSVTLSGLPGSPVTQPSGMYYAAVTKGWSGTASPVRNGLIFTPTDRSYSNVTTNKSGQDYTATPITYTISGTVTYNGSGLAGVTLSGLPGNPVSDVSGSYSATVTYGWGGEVIPTKSGYTFLPSSLSYYGIIADQTRQDYTASLKTFNISGTVTHNGSGLAGVTLSGLPGNPITNASGVYSATVTNGWSGTVTPNFNGYSFTPVSLTYNNVTSNQNSQNYTALMTYTISGTVTYNGSGLAGVTLNGLPGNPITNASGAYSAIITYGWNGTVMPTLNGYAFTPTSRNYSNVTADQAGQDYAATLLTCLVSGTISYNGSGLAGVILNGLPGTPITDTSGIYSTTVPYGWNGTATPTLNGYTFTPTSRSYHNVTSNQTGQDYTAILMTYTISGTVTLNSSGLAGVTLSGLPGNPVSNASGAYSATVNYGWNGTVTPVLAGYTFAPVNKTYDNVTVNQTGQDFTATLMTYTISGTVTLNSSGLAGVTLSGLPGNPVTNSSGAYSASVAHGWSGTATPALNGYTFTPVSRTYNNVTSDQIAQDYAVTQLTYTISGRVTYNSSSLANVTLNGLPGNPVTNSSGNYTATVPYGWSGTATPTKSGYAFTPVSRTYNNVTSNQTGQNFTATLTYTISGRVTYNGSGLAGVTLTGLPGNPVTNASGNYSAIVTRGWSGTVRPTLSGYTFSPSSRSYSNVTSNKTSQNYTAYH